MSDIVERLRAWDAWDPPIGFDERKGHVAPQHVSGAEAADEIERLRALLKEAGEAMEPIAQRWIDPLSIAREHWQRARTILSKIKGEA